MALLARARLALWGALALAPLGSLALTGCTPPLAPTLTRDGAVRLRHRDPGIRACSVVGDFNDWRPGQAPLQRRGAGRFEGELRLPPGTYVYAFAEELPDGGSRVVAPEQAPAYVEDDLGGRSGVLVVPVTSREASRP